MKRWRLLLALALPGGVILLLLWWLWRRRQKSQSTGLLGNAAPHGWSVQL